MVYHTQEFLTGWKLYHIIKSQLHYIFLIYEIQYPSQTVHEHELDLSL